MSATADRIERIPRPEEPVPAVPWPTVGLFALGLLLFGGSWGFDWLPHHGLGPSRERNDHFPSTRNRVGLERLLTPLMLYQNYHLVHHLHPVIPFHRYIAVWRRNENEYLERDPVLSSPLGREVTPDEYRRLRELDH